jgi:tetratricopeptide (TPR) repeat protein
MSVLLALAFTSAPSWGQELPELLVQIHWARAKLGLPALSGPEEELFALGVFLQGTGRNAEARALFQEILQRFPDSDELGEVWLGIGDTFEGEDQHAEAHSAYLRASTYLTGKRRVLALDRAAWELAHQGEPDRAFALVVEAIEHSFGSGQEIGELFEVQREALRDLVVFAAQVDADEHPRRSPYGLAHMETLWELHARMAGLYRQAGEIERAALIEGWLLRLTTDPTDL